jgi:hypothetical protein
MSDTDEKVAALVDVCVALSEGQRQAAAAIIASRYPFVPPEKMTRRKPGSTMRQVLELFVRDGFIDRYSGDKLFCPPALHLINRRLPEQFPRHPHGKFDACHRAFWDQFATLDHVNPSASGGGNDASNWVTTSMTRNLLKAHRSLAELGWELHPEGRMEAWDGMLNWFVSQVAADPSILSDPYLRNWHTAAQRVLLSPTLPQTVL